MKLDAITFRKVLYGNIALLIVATGGAYYYMNGILQAKATELNHARIDAELGDNETASLQQLQAELDKYKDVIPRAKEIVASATDFKYQDQVIRDINTLASRSNITITGYSFSGGSAGDSAAPATAAPPTEGSTEGGTSGTPQAKKVTMTITVKSPIKYDDYLRFLRLMERNITRLQVTGVNLSPDPQNKDYIINPSVGIEIFVKG